MGYFLRLALQELYLEGNPRLRLDEAFGDLFTLQSLLAVSVDSNVKVPPGLVEKMKRRRREILGDETPALEGVTQ